jgi:hypothetical protein
MKNSIIKLSLLAVTVVFAFDSCKKDDVKEPLEYDRQSSEDNALAENTFSDMGTMSDQAADSNSISYYRPGENNSLLGSGCATVSLVAGNPNVITVNFNSNWCQCWDGRYRKGLFTVSYTGGYRDSTTVITVAATSSDNYFVSYPNDSTRWIKVTGTHVVTNHGHNSNGHLWYDVNVNGTLILNNGTTMTWTSQRVREWVAGESTASWLDDQYSITGTASGTSFSGVHYTVAIDNNSPLFVDLTCFAQQLYSCKITKGKFSLTPDNKPTRYVDFGTGACDNYATVTVNGATYPIVVR